MDFKIAKAVYNRTIKLTGIEVSVLTNLAFAAKNDSTLPSPSIKRLADRSGFSVGAVVKALDSLTARGIVSISKRQTESGQHCNVYTVHHDKLGHQQPKDESIKSSSGEPLKSSCGEPLKSSQEFTRVHKGSSGVIYKHIDNNIDNNIDKKQSSKYNEAIYEAIDIEAPLFREDAIKRLVDRGFEKEAARESIDYVWDTFSVEAKALKELGYPDIKHPRAYLLGKLASTAQASAAKMYAQDVADYASLEARATAEGNTEMVTFYREQKDFSQSLLAKIGGEPKFGVVA